MILENKKHFVHTLKRFQGESVCNEEITSYRMNNSEICIISISRSAATNSNYIKNSLARIIVIISLLFTFHNNFII